MVLLIPVHQILNSIWSSCICAHLHQRHNLSSHAPRVRQCRKNAMRRCVVSRRVDPAKRPEAQRIHKGREQMGAERLKASDFSSHFGAESKCPTQYTVRFGKFRNHLSIESISSLKAVIKLHADGTRTWRRSNSP